MYQHVDRHGEDTRVFADFVAWQLLNAHYEHPATTYVTNYGESGTGLDGEMVVVYRSYATTDHASYYVRYRGRNYRVVGSLPTERSTDSTVYTNGPDQLVWRVETGS